MGKIVAWDSLKPGDVVWEEWLYGAGTIKAKILRYGTKAGDLVIRYGENLYGCTMRQRAEYRYWDSEPTMEKMKVTGWEGQA